MSLPLALASSDVSYPLAGFFSWISGSNLHEGDPKDLSRETLINALLDSEEQGESQEFASKDKLLLAQLKENEKLRAELREARAEAARLKDESASLRVEIDSVRTEIGLVNQTLEASEALREKIEEDLKLRRQVLDVVYQATEKYRLSKLSPQE